MKSRKTLIIVIGFLTSLLVGGFFYLYTLSLLFTLISFGVTFLAFMIFGYKKINNLNMQMKQSSEACDFLFEFVLLNAEFQDIDKTLNKIELKSEGTLEIELKQLAEYKGLDKLIHLRDYFNTIYLKLLINYLTNNKKEKFLISDNETLIREVFRYQESIENKQKYNTKLIIEFTTLWLLAFIVIFAFQFILKNYYQKIINNLFFIISLFVFLLLFIISYILLVNELTKFDFLEDKIFNEEN